MLLLYFNLHRCSSKESWECSCNQATKGAWFSNCFTLNIKLHDTRMMDDCDLLPPFFLSPSLLGARVNAKDNKWLTPLHRAVASCSEVSCYSTCTHTDANKCTHNLLIHSLTSSLSSRLVVCVYVFVQDAVQVLLKHSADVNARDKNWQTPLHVAAANKAVRCAEALVPLLSNVNVSDRAGRTALHHAAFSGHLEVPLSTL